MLLINLLFLPVFAQISRIESKRIPAQSSTAIYLKYGLVSVVEFPKDIMEVRIGNPNIVKAIISNVSGRELTLYYKVESNAATNLIVRAGKDTFVLDLLPSKSNHQDFVQIRGVTAISQNRQELDTIKLTVERPKKLIKVEEVIKL